MRIPIANKFAKFHAKRLNRSENIPKRFRGLLFSETPGRPLEYEKICLLHDSRYEYDRT